ncbi:hypothetical protein AB0F20_05525 [Streptomyces goshikiensis]|uniref:hypothetical protein n=1 Tax=Streptomyces goshikiensis TaxID=1942 RepID=UPI0033C465CA
MRNTITIRRWRIDIYGNALYVQKQPKPKCKDCRGHGSIESTPADHDRLIEAVVEPCDCWDPFRSLRIPLWRRPIAADRWPF